MESMDYAEYCPAVLRILASRGLLVGTYDAAGRPNLMTIGWGALGVVWGRPLWTVLIRPSRHTWEGIERRGCFTVNVPTAALEGVCELCGTRSGRDTDKFAACGLTPARASTVDAPVVGECPIIYECKVVHSNDVEPPRLAEEIASGSYRNGDYHRIYWGEILAARVDRNVARAFG